MQIELSKYGCRVGIVLEINGRKNIWDFINRKWLQNDILELRIIETENYNLKSLQEKFLSKNS